MIRLPQRVRYIIYSEQPATWLAGSCFPALFSLYKEGKLAEDFAVVGLARRPRTNEQFRVDLQESIDEFCRYKADDAEQWARFASHFVYMSLDINNVDGFRELGRLTKELDAKFDIPGNRLFYLALAPELFGPCRSTCATAGCWNPRAGIGSSSRSRSATTSNPREQAERADHAKCSRKRRSTGSTTTWARKWCRTSRCIRFSNAFFEPLWNNKHIANVQITLSETVGVEERGGYYDKSGALRDMVQNHMMQMLAMIAMEPPSRLHPEDIRDEKVKVLRSLRPFAIAEEVGANVIRGQYTRRRDQGKAA